MCARNMLKLEMRQYTGQYIPYTGTPVFQAILLVVRMLLSLIFRELAFKSIKIHISGVVWNRFSLAIH